MRSVEMTRGRMFVLTLDTGESVKGCVESFCIEHSVKCAKVTILGGIGKGSSFVCGPFLENGEETTPIIPLSYTVDAPVEFAGVGTVFPDESGKPVMHLHGSVGRDGTSVTGCFRETAKAWLTLEIVIEELLGEAPVRKLDKEKKVAPLFIE